eukprot:2664944-Ditylum_brightwellii.AAC.1
MLTHDELDIQLEPVRPNQSPIMLLSLINTYIDFIDEINSMYERDMPLVLMNMAIYVMAKPDDNITSGLTNKCHSNNDDNS